MAWDVGFLPSEKKALCSFFCLPPPQCSPLNEFILMQSFCLKPSVVANSVDVVYMYLLKKNSTEDPVGVAWFFCCRCYLHALKFSTFWCMYHVLQELFCISFLKSFSMFVSFAPSSTCRWNGHCLMSRQGPSRADKPSKMPALHHRHTLW